jgi:hypothetical protein
MFTTIVVGTSQDDGWGRLRRPWGQRLGRGRLVLCVALAGGERRSRNQGDASVPTPRRTSPAPTGTILPPKSLPLKALQCSLHEEVFETHRSLYAVILSASFGSLRPSSQILRCPQSLPSEKRRGGTSLSVWLSFPRFHLHRCKCHACLPELLLNRTVLGVWAGVNSLPALVEKQARHCLNVWRRSVVDHALSDWLR